MELVDWFVCLLVGWFDELKEDEMNWACGMCGKVRITYRILVGKPEGKKDNLEAVAYRGRGGLNHPPLPLKFQSFNEAEPNFQFHGKYIRNILIRIWVSLICKLSRTPD
jgi:hypothetical protein